MESICQNTDRTEGADPKEIDRMNVALQIIRTKKGPLYNIRKISRMTGSTPIKIRQLISYYKLAESKNRKSKSTKNIGSISDIESVLRLEGKITDVLCFTNDENEVNDEDAKKESNIVITFIFFVMLLAVLGVVYILLLSPSDNAINHIILKFTSANGDYSIPKHIAERYLTWYGMRTFFFGLHYSLTLLGIVASLMTVFYASSKTKGGENSKIVFLSLLSLSFSMANIFINAGSQANMAQHAWRELDICIMDTIHQEDLSEDCRNQIIARKIAEMERYIETFEH